MIKNFLDDQDANYRKFELRHIKYAVNLVKDAKKRLNEEISRDVSPFKQWQVLGRLGELDNVYNSLSTQLKLLQKKYTIEGIQLGLFDVLKYAGMAGRTKKYQDKAITATLQPKVNENVLKNIGKNYYGYLDGIIEHSKTLTIKQYEKIQKEIGFGAIKGEGEAQTIRRAIQVATDDGNNNLFAPVKRHVHHTLSNVYNQSRVGTIESLAEDDDEMGLQWMSRLHHSTPICLGLHGQKVKAGQKFKWRGWEGLRPPAVGSGAQPRWHICYSTVIPWHPDWPDNPKIQAQQQLIQEDKINSTTERMDAVKAGKAEAKQQQENKKQESSNKVEFVEAKTIKETEEWAKNKLGIKKVNYEGLELEAANETNKALHYLIKDKGYKPILSIKTEAGLSNELAYVSGQHITIKEACFNPKRLKEALLKNKEIINNKIIGQSNVGDSLFDVILHEFGHIVHGRSSHSYATGHIELGGTSYTTNSVIKGKISKRGKAIANKISLYASTSTHEHFAEAWAAYHRGDVDMISPEVVKIIENVILEEKG